MNKYLFYIVFGSWLISITIHILTFFGLYTSESEMLGWMVIPLLLVVLFRFISIFTDPGFSWKDLKSGKLSPFNHTDLLQFFEYTPKWMIIATLSLFGYTIINFIWFFVNYAGSPVILDGQYYLQDHGKVIQNLTEHEYLQYQSVSVRFISCNLILFYSIVTSGLYKYR